MYEHRNLSEVALTDCDDFTDPSRHGARLRADSRQRTNGQSHLCRRLFLVHGNALRRARRRDVDDLRYIGGTKKNPTYEQVVSGNTGHAEAVEITYDPQKISYEKLLEVFWRNIDPLTANAQFCDSGNQYRSAIFYHDDAQKKLAETSRKSLQGRFKQPIVTEIVRASEFYPAEDYRQDYYKKNPIRYKIYRFGCGRDQRLQELWGSEKK
jgi:methionine-S-sulfoxide reductase